MADPTHAHLPPRTSVSEQELSLLARIAGLSIAEHRLPAMARDLTATLEMADDLDAVLENTSPVIRPFDPSWSAAERTGTGR
jgi:Asp-tRNA(Asn)/Glu-tRNA(Gln) amidotransferase C subunit